MLQPVNTVLSGGVRLSLKGAAIANNSFVDVDDIGDNNGNALLCHTDKIDCCPGNTAAGDWYFPNESRVKSIIDNMRLKLASYFSRSRGTSVVRLIRVGAPTERGRFYCQVPNASGVIQTISVNIGE